MPFEQNHETFVYPYVFINSAQGSFPPICCLCIVLMMCSSVPAFFPHNQLIGPPAGLTGFSGLSLGLATARLILNWPAGDANRRAESTRDPQANGSA